MSRSVRNRRSLHRTGRVRPALSGPARVRGRRGDCALCSRCASCDRHLCPALAAARAAHAASHSAPVRVGVHGAAVERRPDAGDVSERRHPTRRAVCGCVGALRRAQRGLDRAVPRLWRRGDLLGGRRHDALRGRRAARGHHQERFGVESARGRSRHGEERWTVQGGGGVRVRWWSRTRVERRCAGDRPPRAGFLARIGSGPRDARAVAPAVGAERGGPRLGQRVAGRDATTEAQRWCLDVGKA